MSTTGSGTTNQQSPPPGESGEPPLEGETSAPTPTIVHVRELPSNPISQGRSTKGLTHAELLRN